MRSAAVLLLKPRCGGTRRSAVPKRTRARREPLPLERRRRHPGARMGGAARVVLDTMPARPTLCRVRPLRVIPRGVVPYLKH